MTYSGLAVGLADELYAALRNSTTQYNLCFTASVSVREAVLFVPSRRPLKKMCQIFAMRITWKQ